LYVVLAKRGLPRLKGLAHGIGTEGLGNGEQTHGLGRALRSVASLHNALAHALEMVGNHGHNLRAYQTD
jgi:hypothetical protein